MELVQGVTLKQLLQQKPLPPEVAACIMVEVLDALVHAYQLGVVHRDIKPEKVMVVCQSPSELPKGREEASPLSPSGEEVARQADGPWDY
ncbi:hypothetical protein BCY86_01425 [Pajaroellobacter abortibovis]|uniref:Protein kinase domain-containing protein n=1 Tax=Pajaroellobacter abortibovis TaxID=1882918 RepID=A0A1L6MVD8_9BACT|nr:hypothetical protein BCY86_01425 [Pajaroellobacter abortibovis]